MVDMKSEFNMENVKALINKGQNAEQQMMSGQTGKYEVNLVPDVKAQMLKQQHVRNIVFFVCLIIAGLSVGVVALFGLIKAGQDITMATQDHDIEEWSKKIGESEQLSEFLTIQDQLGRISRIEENKHVMSRVFNILVTMQPTSNNDVVKFSELNVNLAESTLDFEGQAKAGDAGPINYRVLESFKKNIGLMTYDYGRYVDQDGNIIPTRCIVETDADGNLLKDNGNLYGIWKRGYKGCDPQRDDYSTEEGEEGQQENVADNPEEGNPEEENVENPDDKDERIWRTPQFEKWYSGKTGNETEDTADGQEQDAEQKSEVKFIDESGTISGIPHFESACFRYSLTKDKDDKDKWLSENDCKLTTEDMEVLESRNARNEDSELVLSFSAAVQLNPEVFKFTNKHMIAVPPFEQNVTDSYRQVKGMDNVFVKKATECSDGDSDCKKNEGGR